MLALTLAERLGVQVSASTVRRALHAVGFSWHRPKLTPARQPDPQRATREARLAEVLASSPDATLIVADECEVHLLAVLRAMGQRIGEQLRLPTPGHNQRRSVFGGLNIRTGQWHYLLTDHKRTADFIAFLTLLTQVYATGPIFVIVDNASIHASQALMTWLAEQPRLQLVVYLPIYSGHQLNPVVWWAGEPVGGWERTRPVRCRLGKACHRPMRTIGTNWCRSIRRRSFGSPISCWATPTRPPT